MVASGRCSAHGKILFGRIDIGYFIDAYYISTVNNLTYHSGFGMGTSGEAVMVSSSSRQL